MYNQVNNGPNFGQGPQTSMRPAYQQCPQAPPHPPYFQQGPPPPPPPPPPLQYAPTAGPYHIGLPGHQASPHRPPGTSSTVPQNPSFQVPPIVMQNTGQSYVAPPLLHGNTMLPHTFSSAGQNSHHSLNLGSQNHHIPPPLPLSSDGLLHQEASWAPAPPTILPPPVPSASLPPPPSSLPPIPPPPPLVPPVISAPVSNTDTNQDIRSISVILNLPPPPPLLIHEKTVEKIEALCQLIAESGPEVEDRTRQNEFENPEYAFLFGGDPGTEAANSHEYFMWMKQKYNLGHRGHNENSESQLRPLAVDSSRKHDHLNIAPECSLAYDSDMEMEDDITLSDKDQGWNPTIEGPNQQHDGADRDSIMNEQTLQPQSSTENNPVDVSKQMAEFSLGTALDQLAAPLADVVTKFGASVPAEDINPDRDSDQLIKGGSPIKLLQDYASDDTSDNEKATCLVDGLLTVSPTAVTRALVADKDSGDFSKTHIRSKSPSRTQKEFVMFSQSSQNYSQISPKLGEAIDACKKSSSSRTNDGYVEQNRDNQATINFSASTEAFHGRDGLCSAGVDSGSKSSNAECKEKNITSQMESNPMKVNESRRLAGQGPTDSDSGDSHKRRTRRRKKRDRSWSRSQSPLDRRRRRRSPLRRKAYRSRSRSWSPRNRRSRSRSPIFRRSGDFSREKMKRDKGECFEFLRGKCYRGASCRYMHYEPDKDVSSKHHRNGHDAETSSYSKKPGSHGGQKNISALVKDQQCKGVGSQEAQLGQNISGSSAGREVEERKDVSIENVAVLDHDGRPAGIHPSKSGSLRKVVHKLQEASVLGEEPKTAIHDNGGLSKTVDSHQQLSVDGFPSDTITSGDAWKQSDGTSQDIIPSGCGSSSDQFKCNASVEEQEHSRNPSQPKNMSDSLPVERSMAPASKFSSSEPLLCMLPSQQAVNQWFSPEQSSLHSKASKELPAHSSSTVDLPPHSYPLRPPPPLSHSQGENAVHMPQISRDYGMMQQDVLRPYQSAATESLQPSHFSVLPKGSLTSLPPQPPLSWEAYSSSLNAGVATSHVSSEFNQSQLHSRTDFVSQISERPVLPFHSQGSQYHDHSHPSTQGDRGSQSFAGSYFAREGYYKQASVLDSKFSSSSSFHSLHPQPKHFSWDSTAEGLHLSSGGKFPVEEPFKTFSHVYPFSQKQPIHNLSVSSEAASVSRYLPDVLNSNHSASLPDFVGSRIRAHYNPYASTFEQPLSSKFSSSIFRQEKDTLGGDNFGSSSSLNHSRINGQGDLDVGLSQIASSPKFARAVGQVLPKTRGDQYDPLFDSIEPSSSSFKKFDLDQKQEVTGESNISLMHKSSRKSLDSDENKDGQVGVVGLTTSQNNDEYGETADAEVGAVENESLSNPVDIGNMTPGEIEIDQIKSPGKRKKSKDSRSMRLFKVSIANFVKEVLKPSWRQGNMSKVAFKTIVKKTVDKVSGAMKGHHIPKSQAKINQYIDSSQRKLTKLVMGYVDKYVKV